MFVFLGACLHFWEHFCAYVRPSVDLMRVNVNDIGSSALFYLIMLTANDAHITHSTYTVSGL